VLIVDYVELRRQFSLGFVWWYDEMLCCEVVGLLKQVSQMANLDFRPEVVVRTPAEQQRVNSVIGCLSVGEHILKTCFEILNECSQAWNVFAFADVGIFQ
jgi:hypothetical protein